MFAKKRERLIKTDEQPYKFKHFMHLNDCELLSLDDRGLKSFLEFRGIPFSEDDKSKPGDSSGTLKRTLAGVPSEVSLRSVESKETMVSAGDPEMPGGNDVDTSNGLVQYVFRARDEWGADDFLKKFREAKDALNPRNQPSALLNLWVKDNMALAFNVFNSTNEFQKCTQKVRAIKVA
jgi:hypothetical protein